MSMRRMRNLQASVRRKSAAKEYGTCAWGRWCPRCCARAKRSRACINPTGSASVYPIYEAGEKKGTVSIVTTLEQSRARKRPGGGTLKERVREFERQEIRRTLLLYDDNLEGKKQAAEALGISLSTLYSKMESK